MMDDWRKHLMDYEPETSVKLEVETPPASRAASPSYSSPFRFTSCDTTASERQVHRDVLAFWYDGRSSPSPTPTPEPIWSNFDPQRASVMTESSVNTVISAGTLAMDLSEFLQTISDRRSLQRAEIRSVEQYWVWTGTVYHRFLILELFRKGRKAIWVRLDRHRGGGLLKLATGTAPARDVAILRADKETLSGGAHCENKQVFTMTPTLGDLRHLLRAITQELRTYTLWPLNCYFFCSLIQGHLGDAKLGKFIHGELYNPSMAQAERARISECVRSICKMPAKPKLRDLFRTLDPHRPWPLAEELLKLSAEFDRSLSARITQYGKVVEGVYRLIPKITPFLCETFDNAFALSVHRAAHQWSQELDLRFSSSNAKSLPAYEPFLVSYRGLCLLHGSHNIDKHDVDVLLEIHESFWELGFSSLSDELKQLSDDVELMRMLYTIDADRHREDLSESIRKYVDFLRLFGRIDEACELGAEQVYLRRVLYADDADRHRLGLTKSLLSYGISLREAGRYSEACEACAEGVALQRVPSAKDAGGYELTLAKSLHQYGISLRECGRVSEACDAHAEGVELKRVNYAKDAAPFNQHQLNASLHEYSISLRAIGRVREADSADAECTYLDCLPDEFMY